MYFNMKNNSRLENLEKWPRFCEILNNLMPQFLAIRDIFIFIVMYVELLYICVYKSLKNIFLFLFFRIQIKF